MSDWYPESELEDHGLTANDWDAAGCYALSLERPRGYDDLRERWSKHYDVDPPHDLIDAVETYRPLFYVGATGCLLDRLHGHVAGDVRRVKLLAVCPPTGVVDVWQYPDFETAQDHERQHAYGLRDAEPGRVCWVNGEVV